MAVETELKTIGDVVKREWDKLYNRETVTILSGQVVAVGEVVSFVAVGTTAIGAAAAGNTGDGTIGTVSAGTAAKAGAYRVTITTAQANAGLFSVEDPDGVTVGTGTVGVAYTGGPNFTISDGATDFIVGDAFTVTVATGSLKYKSYDNEAAAGANVVLGVMLEAVDATAGDLKGVILARGPAVVDKNSLVFGVGVTTDAEKDAAYEDLRRIGIVPRTGIGAAA